jgi:hypothetical protein
MATRKLEDLHRATFLVARNPEEDSKLPFLVRLPIDGGLVLKTRDVWPKTARVYCHPFDGWPDIPDVVDEAPVALCKRRGPAIDLVLDRPRQARSQFVFTEVRGRPAIFWQTQRTARAANPGGRVPRGRAVEETITICIDTRERYPYRFASRPGVERARVALPAGDYAVRDGDTVLAAVERKSIENLSTSLSDGTLAFQIQRLAEMPKAAVVVEGRYPGLLALHSGRASFLADVLARLQLRYPEVQIVFADNRKFAEEWTYRYLSAALGDEL